MRAKREQDDIAHDDSFGDELEESSESSSSLDDDISSTLYSYDNASINRRPNKRRRAENASIRALFNKQVSQKRGTKRHRYPVGITMQVVGQRGMLPKCSKCAVQFERGERRVMHRYISNAMRRSHIMQ